jgi:Cu(I)/Ag(I) efflux system membrane protein CusA/SilA
MLATGVRSPLGIRVFGNDLATIERTAIDIEQAVATIPGTRSAYAERSVGGYYLDIVTRRRDAARYGLNVDDVHEAVRTLVGGMPVAETIEGRERYPISVRLARETRDSPAMLERVLVPTASGALIPLRQVADIKHVMGPDMIRSEAGQLVGYVFVDTDRPIADYVDEARAVVARDVQLPPGVRLEWTGQYRYYERAKERLKAVVPLTLFLIVMLIYLNTRSLVETGIVMLAVPFSLIGAIWLVYLLGYHSSIAVWVGVIALAGLDAETGVVMLLYLTLAHRQFRERGRMRTRADLEEAIVEGAAKRVRPKLMTVLVAMIGLVPILWSEGTGADVMRRIAAPMIGGLVTSFLLELTVYPAIFAIWKERELARNA